MKTYLYGSVLTGTPHCMFYNENTGIDTLSVHFVGNEAKDEPLLVAPCVSDQSGDGELMCMLTNYFVGGFKCEEYSNFCHETDLAYNEVWSFAGQIFDDPELFYEHSVGMARHLYECGTHPRIRGVIEPDRNFHIYVHGNRNLPQQAKDEKNKFYRVYYQKEE